MKIKTEDIEKILGLLIAKLKEGGISYISVENDYYWKIIEADAYNFEKSPDPATGSLIDDWESLQKVLNNEQIFSYGLDLQRVAAILNAISAAIVPINKDGV